MRRTRKMGKRLGDHLVMCDVSGWTCWASEVIERWDGAIVHKDFWEPRHPQDFVRGVKDDQSVSPVNPEPEDNFICSNIYLAEDEVYLRSDHVFYKCGDS
jgi:hypothetical protein